MPAGATIVEAVGAGRMALIGQYQADVGWTKRRLGGQNALPIALEDEEHLEVSDILEVVPKNKVL
jgi:hypothetical protein